jgi:hypothetical protein
MDQTTTEVRQNLEVVRCFATAFFMDSVKCKMFGAGHMKPVAFSGGAGAAFIDMNNRALYKRLYNRLLERLEIFIASL